MAKSKSDKGISKIARIFIALFGLPFFALGCFTGFLAFRMMVTYFDARNWVETPARIQTVNLESHSGESTTYEVQCAYEYEFAGRAYTGRRVGLSESSENGSWHQDTYRRLKRLRDENQIVPCYVNPDKPEEAILDRQIRFRTLAFFVLIAILFGGFGSGLIWLMFYAGRALRKEIARTEAYPDQPWMRREDWASGTISPKLGQYAAVLWFFAIFWNAVSSPIWFFLPGEVFVNGNVIALIALLFPLIGVGLLTYAIRATIRKRKYGRSYLKLETIPGVVGGHLTGDLVIVTDTVLDHLEIALKCVRKITERNDESNDVTENTLWQYQQRLDALGTTFGQTELRVPIDFQIPYKCSPSDNTKSNSEVIWRLLANGSAPGVDLSLAFEVPVFRTQNSDVTVGESPARIAAERAALESDESPLPSKLRIRPDLNGDPCLTNSCWPGTRVIGVMLLFVTIFDAAGIGMGVLVAKGHWFAIFFLLMFGGIGLLLTFCLITMFGSYHLRLGSHDFTVTRKLGPFTSRRVALFNDIREIIMKQSSGSGDQRWYRVSARLKNRKLVQLVDTVEGELAAKWVFRQIEQHLTAKHAEPVKFSISAKTLSSER